MRVRRTVAIVALVLAPLPIPAFAAVVSQYFLAKPSLAPATTPETQSGATRCWPYCYNAKSPAVIAFMANRTSSRGRRTPRWSAVSKVTMSVAAGNFGRTLTALSADTNAKAQPELPTNGNGWQGYDGTTPP